MSQRSYTSHQRPCTTSPESLGLQTKVESKEGTSDQCSYLPLADSVKMVGAVSASRGRGTLEFRLYVSFLVIWITGTEVPHLMKCSWLSASSVYNGTKKQLLELSKQ